MATISTHSLKTLPAGATGAPKLGIGVVVAALAGLVIFGGIRSIAKVAEIVVPFMAVTTSPGLVAAPLGMFSAAGTAGPALIDALGPKGKDIKAAEVGRELNVAHILEGSVRKAGNQVRITAQLIQADNGYHLWSETYDRQLDNVFQIQEDIAKRLPEGGARVLADQPGEISGLTPSPRAPRREPGGQHAGDHDEARILGAAQHPLGDHRDGVEELEAGSGCGADVYLIHIDRHGRFLMAMSP